MDPSPLTIFIFHFSFSVLCKFKAFTSKMRLRKWNKQLNLRHCSNGIKSLLTRTIFFWAVYFAVAMNRKVVVLSIWFRVFYCKSYHHIVLQSFIINFLLVASAFFFLSFECLNCEQKTSNFVAIFCFWKLFTWYAMRFQTNK